MKALEQLRPEEQRAGLVSVIERLQPQGSLRNQVTIVFDGRRGGFQLSSGSHIKIIFSVDDSADNTIRDIVENEQNKKNIMVVTNDRAIQYAVRSMGATICPVEEFLAKMEKNTPSQADHKQGEESPKKIPPSLEAKINAELRRLWLKEKD